MFRIALGFQRDTEEVEDRPAVLIPLPHSVLPERVGAAGGGEDHGAAAVGIGQVEGVETGIPFIEGIDIALLQLGKREHALDVNQDLRGLFTVEALQTFYAD